MNKLKALERPSLRQAGLFAALLLLCGLMTNSLAQQNQEDKEGPIQVDANMLIRETQKVSKTANEMTLTWWIPEQFWQVSSVHDPTVTAQQAERLIKVIRPYMLIIVADGRIDSTGAITYKTEAMIRTEIRIKDSRGNSYQPLSEDKISLEARSFLSVMKPVLAGMSGSMGQKMHLFFFDAESKNGGRIADAKKQGVFSVKLGRKEFRWRLPLGSLVAPKICPGCKESCSRAWNFCPWCGTMLLKIDY